MLKNKYKIRSSKKYLATIYHMKIHVLFNIFGQIWLLSILEYQVPYPLRHSYWYVRYLQYSSSSQVKN